LDAINAADLRHGVPLSTAGSSGNGYRSRASFGVRSRAAEAPPTRDAARMATRRRCSECRKPFISSPRAGAKQRVCRSVKCRASRDRKLARARRRREVDVYRADERERQRSSRRDRAETAREAGSSDKRHTPASASNTLETQDEFLEIVVRVSSASRATIVRTRSLKRLPARKILAAA